MAVTHISEAEVIRNPAGFLARLRAGEEIVIDTGSQPLSVVLKSEWSKDPSISATRARVQASTLDLGYTPTMDADFIADMEEIVRNRKPRDHSAWD